MVSSMVGLGSGRIVPGCRQEYIEVDKRDLSECRSGEVDMHARK